MSSGDSCNLKFRCVADNHYQKHRVYDDGIKTDTQNEQVACQERVHNCYRFFRNLVDGKPSSLPDLMKNHIEYLRTYLKNIPSSYQNLDASQTWLIYWILHSLSLMQEPISDSHTEDIINHIKSFQHPDGGFGGGPGQNAHLVPTYAAVMSLIIIGTKRAYQVIDRKKLQSFLLRCHNSEGSFYVNRGGEMDMRAVYCAASVAQITNIMTENMFEGTVEWIIRCQTYEGGFGGVPGLEAHGGYSYCGVASLLILGHEKLIDVPSVLRWTSQRQMSMEGGFQGRTNKLVDSCYSFWQGAVMPLLHMMLSKEGDKAISGEKWMFNQGALQEYLLICCQSNNGGFVDKPGKPRDLYHTCYALSGLSVAQHFNEGKLSKDSEYCNPNSALEIIHPLFNVCVPKVESALLHFSKLDIPN